MMMMISTLASVMEGTATINTRRNSGTRETRCSWWRWWWRQRRLEVPVLVMLLLVLVDQDEAGVAAVTAVAGGGPCHWSAEINETRAAYCTLRTLDPPSLVDLSASLEGALKLRLGCSSAHHFESTISAESWQRLTGLHDLVLEDCLLSIKKDSFRPLGELKRLAVRTLNIEWSVSRSLELEPEAFTGLRELQALEISSNLRSLPAGLLCGLGNLQVLNLTGNQFSNVSDFGFSTVAAAASSVVPQECHPDIRVLDLSRNELTSLPEDNSLSAFRGLSDLFLQHNGLTDIHSDSLTGLASLRILNASYNSLSSLPQALFAGTRDLREIHFQYNSLTTIPRGTFTRLEQLLVLNLSGNRLKSDSVNDTTFNGLIRLIVLDLSFNELTHISEFMFKDLFFLQILDLRNNSIGHIEPHAFRPLYNLHTLELSDNRLHAIGPQLFNGLFVLNRLTLSGNMISSLKIAPLAFRNCSDLKELDLSSNQLTSVPEALRNLNFLKTLDLGENRITEFHNGSFANLHQLTGLRLIGNEIGNLTRGMLWDLPNLQILNLARNKIQHVERDTFERNTRLEAIRLDGNFLSDINGVFAGITSLLLLNLSENHIEWFDYAFIPSNLKWLDIHGNFIEKLGNYYMIRDQKVRTLDASHNRITELTPLSVPDSVELLFINNNYISTVRPNTFVGKTNLTRVDMYANMIETMELAALRLSSPSGPSSSLSPGSDAEEAIKQPLPEFYLGGNPFNCNCSMDWLPVINNMSAQQRQHPRVMDLENAMCRITGPRGTAVVPASSARPEQFLCRYEAHCFALCHCCDFDACDCEMTCPSDCKCYHDQTWNTNVVDCSGLGSRDIPRRIPMDATEVYLDGNDLRELQNHVFIGRKNMRVLYVNASGIESIQNRTFNGLNNLQVLHLEDNRIQELRGFEFEHLAHLRELYLQNNVISFIGNLTLLPLRSLEVLKLHGNRLVTFPVWQVGLNARLTELSLGSNLWSCRCKFLQELTAWMSENAHKVVDATDVWCYNNEVRPAYRRKLDVNETACSDYFAQGGSGGVIESLVSDYLPTLAATLSVVLLLLVLGVMGFIFREPVRTWAYSRYGVRFLAKAQAPEDKERLYDGYVCYSPKDEDFVLHSLAAELEHGVEGLRLCLHHRDLPCLRAAAPVVLEAAEASRRVLVVLTRNFMQTEWARFEFRAAMHEALRGRPGQLVVIQVGPVSHELETDLELRPYLHTAVILRWGERKFWERLRYALPPGDALGRKTSSLYRRNVNTYTLEGRPEKPVPSPAHHHHHHQQQQQQQQHLHHHHHHLHHHHPHLHHQQQQQQHHHPLFKDSTGTAVTAELMQAPPAYSSTAILGHQQPQGGVTVAGGNNNGSQAGNGSSSPGQSTSPSPRLTMNRAYQDNPGADGLNDATRRPLSEHIYSSIDSDYSTLERQTHAWRQQHTQQSKPQSGQAYLV
ncbi:toll-like receptor 7 [Copidosoma floridanum]|uniref:toll-like receptor 7 n=1 Tax=Copidosoma floridanum TaxID=29053 RepID=UPI0006C9DBBC|nr:toll-like receptor 7 [Copidosoma floridanum]